MMNNLNLFNQPGLLGNVGMNFGGLLDPRSQAMLGAAQALTQAGAPSRVPISTGQALANAMAQGVSSYRQAQAAGMKQQMNKMAYDAAILQAQNRKAFSDAVASGDQDAIRAAAARAYPGKMAEQIFAKPQYKQRKVPVKGTGSGFLYQSQESYDGGRSWKNLGPAAPASASTNVSVSMGNKAFEGLLKDYRGATETALAARDNLSTVNQMQTLLEGGVKTGFGRETMMDLQRAYQLIDPDYKIEDVAAGESFVGLSNKIILPQVKKLGVNPTDKDLTFIVKGSPSLSKSAAGNRLMLRALEISYQRQIRLGELSTQFMRENAAALQDGSMDPLNAQIAYNEYLQNAYVTDPVFKRAADDLRRAYADILGGSLTKSSAEAAAWAGGFTN